MGLFSDIGYEIWARERREKLNRQGRYGESLGFMNRPDLNYQEKFSEIREWHVVALVAGIPLLIIGIVLLCQQ